MSNIYISYLLLKVKTWYQNRRTKWKRQAAVGADLLQEPNNFAVIQNLLRTNPYWMQQCMSNPNMYPLIAQRLMPGMAATLINQQQSPTSRPQSTNNNCVNNTSTTPEGSSPSNMAAINPFPLFFAGLGAANPFGLPNSTITTSNSANTTPSSATPTLTSNQVDENVSEKTSPVNQKTP